MSDNLTLDGMPEPPPAWVRPDEAVRMSALELDFMLAAALPHVPTGVAAEEIPVLDAVHLTVSDGLLAVYATDRYTSFRERRPVNQTCGDFAFLLRSGDARSLRVLLRGVLRGLDKDDKADEPVDLVVEHTDDGPTLRALGRDLDVRFTEQDGDYPAADRLLERLLDHVTLRPARTFPIWVNPTLLARVVAAQNAGRGGTAFRYSCSSDPDGRQSPIIVQPAPAAGEPDDDLVIAVMPMRLDDEDRPS